MPPAESARSRVSSLNAPRPGESPVDQPFVVFSQRSFVIDRLGAPVRPPVSVGSAPSIDTIRSDDPSIVQVDRSGALLGIGNGATRVRTLQGEGSSLEVEVRAAIGGIEVVPQRLEVDPGMTARFEVVDAATRQRLPAEAASWVSAAPERASVRGGQVVGGSTPGATAVTVQYGGADAKAEVVVRSPRGRRSLSPPKALLRVGDVRNFQVFNGGGLATSSWQSRNAKVVASLGSGLFQARRAGRTQVCARSLAQQVCSDVEVRP
jgi:hypothetical protein